MPRNPDASMPPTPSDSPTPHALPYTPECLAQSLGTWFAAHKRDLPWRRERTAYRVWLSEVMLQQTRVSVVEDYYRRFLERFPTVDALARASEDEVLALWSGLGYYSRGRNLHRAARAVVDEHGGVFPRTAASLRALPGVGAYTAAAVASLAHGERAAVVDGNVARVLMRVCGDDTPIDGPDGKRRLTVRAAALMDAAAEPGAHNEAMMELGALVCTPKSPTCGACPWRRSCVAREQGTTATLPRKQQTKKVRALDIACLVVVRDESVWLERRASSGLFGGLWEPPAEQVAEGEARATLAAATVEASWRGLARARALPLPRALPPAIVVSRQLTHRDLRFHCMRVDVAGGGSAFVARAGLAGIGVSAAVRAVLHALWAAPDAQAGLSALAEGRNS